MLDKQPFETLRLTRKFLLNAERTIPANKSWKNNSLKQNEIGWNGILCSSGYPGCHLCLSPMTPLL